MIEKVEENLKRLGLSLQTPPAPVANYIPYQRIGASLFISGQVSKTADGNAIFGKLGDDLDLEIGRQAARLCAINILSQLSDALGGNLSQPLQCVRLGGFVNSAPTFTDHPSVVNGASDLMVEVLGEAGRHTRFAVGVASLPLGVAVEVDALFHIGR